TNRPDILDPALLRPGRFDRQITVNYPDIKGREEILKVHAKDKPLEGDVNLSVLAKTTAGFTGADLANLLNEAALLAARKGKKLIGNTELEEATIKVIVGPQKKSKVVTEKERKLTAYHEAGHAIVTKRLKTQDPVHQISIIPSGRVGGYTLSLPSEDKSYMSKVEMEEEIVSLLGGRTAEKLVLGDISTGASNDIQRASQLARNMIMQYGMSEKLGPIVYGTGHTEVFLGKEFSNARNYSEKIAAMIDDETMEIISHAYTKAEKILVEDIEKLHFVAGFLVKNEIMDAEQFEAAISMEDVTEEDLLQIKDEKTKKSKEENRLQQEENERLAKELAKKLNESNESDQDA
ncbi:MAG TPA: ATP-dependent zinc metalloprotease FtsH, partial [Clostridiales bacterium]|nr:ATP-dependent zinc metalloprotease FtsH [Clostridiales bacterium]